MTLQLAFSILSPTPFSLRVRDYIRNQRNTVSLHACINLSMTHETKVLNKLTRRTRACVCACHCVCVGGGRHKAGGGGGGVGVGAIKQGGGGGGGRHKAGGGGGGGGRH